MKKRDTKQVILDKALELFSMSGYDGVTVADIADAVGIKAASLYKHYKSKQDIFDSILELAEAGYRQQAEKLGINGNEAASDAPHYAGMGLDALIQTGTALFLYFLHDETAKKLRRLLTIEQYKNPSASKLFTSQYIDNALDYQGFLFKSFIEQGIMRKVDADVAAAHFYAPIYLMLCRCDNNPECEADALDFIKAHITQFRTLYMLGE